NYLPRIDEALEMLGLWLAEKPEWYLGFTRPRNLNQLAPILSQLNEFENVPAAALLLQSRSVRIRGHDDGIDSLVNEHLLLAVLKPFDYSDGGVEKIETMLHRLRGQQPRSAFDAYLAQSCYDGKLPAFLSRL